MKKTFLAILCAISTAVNAETEWTDTNEKLYIASQVAILADWSTTRNGSRNNFPNGTYETNPLLVRYPSVGKIDLYFIGLLATNHLVAYALPYNLRDYYFTLRIITHGGASIHNVELGWKLNF